MTINLFKKIGVWLTVAALMSASCVYASGDHSSSSSSSDKNKHIHIGRNLEPFIQARNALGLLNGDLNTLLLTLVTSTNPDTSVNTLLGSLQAAYNLDIINQTGSFAAALEEIGVSSFAALNVATQLNLFAVAAENYAIVTNRFVPGTPAEQAAVGAIWVAQTNALIAAINALSPSLDPSQINPLVDQLFVAYVQLINDAANPTANFSGSINERNQAFVILRTLNFYIFRTIILDNVAIDINPFNFI